MENKFAYLLFLLLTIFLGCTHENNRVDIKNLRPGDYRIYQGTPAFSLAKAIDDNDTNEIKRILIKNKSLLAFVDPKYGQTLLALAVINNKFESVKALLESGADPNFCNKYNGKSALMDAAELRGIFSKEDPKYLTILLKYGGNPNLPQKYIDYSGSSMQTPLLIACSRNKFEYVRILINAGADINFKDSNGAGALYLAVNSRNPDLVIYLLKNGADYKQPMIITDMRKKIYITDLLRSWRFNIGSEEYKKKMQIVGFLMEHGMDYRKSKIPEYYYKLYDKNYLEKY